MHYSRAPVRKRPPKKRIFIGRLREVVAYQNRTTGCLFREDVQRQHAFDYSNPRQVWIPDSVTGFQSLSVKLGFWIPVVNQWDSGFLELHWIPNTQDFGLDKQNFLRSQNPSPSKGATSSLWNLIHCIQFQSCHIYVQFHVVAKSSSYTLRACLHGGGGPQVGEVKK